MRSLVVALVAAVPVLSVLGSVAAAPSGDVAVSCRATNPQLPAQLRCIAMEKASQGRLGRAQPSVDPQVWARCQAASASWQEMEACIAQPAVATGTGAAPGGAAEARPDAPAAGAGQPGAPGAPGAAAGTPPAAAAPPAEVGSPSTIILGPQPSAAAPAAPEPDRPTRPVSEEEAERQVKDVLQRSGTPGAHCTKKQYGPGWVTVCE